MIGETVLYHPNNGDPVASVVVFGPPPEKLPAMVTGGVPGSLDLTVYTKNPEHPIIQLTGVPHKTGMQKDQAYYTLKGEE